MEIGQMAMPKPLLSGYFTNNLNSVQNVREVQKSLEETDGILDELKEEQLDSPGLKIDQDRGENAAVSELQTRPQLKIKQSLTRDFSIESLKRAAGQSLSKRTEQKKKKLYVMTPSERNLSIDASQRLIDKARTPIGAMNQSVLTQNNSLDEFAPPPKKSMLSQPSRPPFQFQQLMVKNKVRLA